MIDVIEDVRNELKARGLKYIIVLPYMECKNEYIKYSISFILASNLP